MAAALIAAGALAALGLVGPEGATLRAGPHEQATVQAQLTPGDTLEVRGQRLDHLQVWDHRRERGGYVRASALRLTDAGPADAPGLLAVLRFVRDTPGAESLGIGYAAAYLRAVPAAALDAEPFDALGSLADRLARRASAKGGTDQRLAAQLDAVAAYGVRLQSLERDGSMRLCYDGQAFRQVLARPGATPAQRARAVLGLSRPECTDPALRPSEQEALLNAQTALLDSLRGADLATLEPLLKNRLQMRRASLQATRAFLQARRGESPLAAGQQALDALAAVQMSELADEDLAEHAEAAIRVGASRWAAVPAPVAAAPGARPQFSTQPGQPGETCVLLTDAAHGPAQPLARRCTWGVAWLASASVNARGDAATLAVQPLPGWRELWLARRTDAGWTLEVQPPATGNPLAEDLGHLEFAGWAPEPTPRLLLARESRVDGRASRRFEVQLLTDGSTERQAGSPELLAAFKRWADPAWRRGTVSLR